MKIRNGFVSNSSSTSFVIKNTSKEVKTLVDFVQENPQLIEQFRSQYNWHTEEDGYSQENMLKSAEKEDSIIFNPGEEKNCCFSDEDGSLVGQCFRYILREGGNSNNFTWHENQYFEEEY